MAEQMYGLPYTDYPVLKTQVEPPTRGRFAPGSGTDPGFATPAVEPPILVPDYGARGATPPAATPTVEPPVGSISYGARGATPPVGGRSGGLFNVLMGREMNQGSQQPNYSTNPTNRFAQFFGRSRPGMSQRPQFSPSTPMTNQSQPGSGVSAQVPESLQQQSGNGFYPQTRKY